jgi:multidrug resistance protein
LHNPIQTTNLLPQILQGLAPTILGGISDRFGRRPAFLICFIIYIAANTGLALQTSFVALLILRKLQSSGSSGTIAISNGVVSDVATRAERGSYISLAALGQSLGPTLGPLIGGLLTHFLGWRSIFWFLDIYAGAMLLMFVLFIPETCRNIVGNGSVAPQKWNIPLITHLHNRKHHIPKSQAKLQKKHRPSFLSSLSILFEKEMFLLLIYAGILYAGFYIVIAGLPSQLASTYNYNAIQVGLCYMPIGAGSILSKTAIGRLIDWNFRRHARANDIPIVKTQQTDITNFPVERARLEIGLGLVYLSCVSIIPYGWVMNMANPPLPVILILLFFNAFTTSGSMQAQNVLVVDCNPNRPAAGTAASNIARCLLGAGGVAVVMPLLDKIGRGWTSTLIAGVWVLMSAFWWAVVWWGPRWREVRREKEEAREKEKEKRDGDVNVEQGGGDMEKRVSVQVA